MTGVEQAAAITKYRTQGNSDHKDDVTCFSETERRKSRDYVNDQLWISPSTDHHPCCVVSGLASHWSIFSSLLIKNKVKYADCGIHIKFTD